MPRNRPHYRLEAWKEAMALVSLAYQSEPGIPERGDLRTDFPITAVCGVRTQQHCGRRGTTWL